MQRGEVIAIFCYDISSDRTRERVARALEDHTVRVQESVFEGRMQAVAAARLAQRLARSLGAGDSLRLYRLGSREALNTIVYGVTPPVEAHDFYLL
jgi:CRISPR-associated endonuclease Cas2